MLRAADPNDSKKLLNLLLFSLPSTGSDRAINGPVAWTAAATAVALPMSEFTLRARFTGLFGEARSRVTGFDEAVLGRVERKESLTPGRSGVEKSEDDCGPMSPAGIEFALVLDMDDVDEDEADIVVPTYVNCGWGQGESGDVVWKELPELSEACDACELVRAM